MSKRVDPDQWLKASAVPASSLADDAAWDARAESIVKRAVAAAPAADIDAVLAPVSLTPEQGEPKNPSAAPVIVGAMSMSDSDNSDPKGSSPPMSQRSSVGPQSMRGRPSLKELAERVSKTPPPSSVVPAPRDSAVPPPSAAPSSLGALAQQVIKAGVTPLPKPAPSSPPASTATPLSVGSAPPPSMPPASVAPASTAAPASAVAPVIPITAAKKEEEKKGSGFAGIAIALVGVAAAAAIFFFLQRDAYKSKPDEPVKQAEAPAAEEPKKDEAAEAPPPEAPPSEDDGSVDIDNLAEASAEPEAPPPPTGGGAVAPTSTAVADLGPGKEGPTKVNADGTLDEAMRDAAGVDGGTAAATPAAEDENRPKNIPDRPPTGAVTAAVGSVMGGAKACVAGADEPSKATITFGSSGAVKSVSVGGWAAGKPAASCIQNALKGANVGPFSQPTFVFGVTIRP